MAKKIWKDHNGNAVPATYVPKLDKDRERIAMSIYNKAIALSDKLKLFKAESFDVADALFDAMLEEAKVKQNGKGNYSITSFDKEIKIEVSIQETVDFDDSIQIAHLKIKEYLEEKTGGVDHELQEIISHAFATTRGKMDIKRVLGLFKLKIKHPLWIEAMELIKQSISRNHSKRYMRVFKKDGQGEYRAVDLNFSSL